METNYATQFILPHGSIKRIHVNQHDIRHNKKFNDSRPPLRVKCGGKNFIGDDVQINGPSRLVYRQNNPLSCGARVFIETESEVVLTKS